MNSQITEHMQNLSDSEKSELLKWNERIKVADFNKFKQGNSDQGTEQWFKERKGNFTGSKISELMKCGRATSQKKWNLEEKIKDLGTGAVSYIFEKAMERKTGKVLKTKSTTDMKYGNVAEKYAIEKYLKGHTELLFSKCDYVPHSKYNFIGASPDGKFTHKTTGTTFASEVKCPTSWSGWFKRTEIDFNEKHMDYWQKQTEMLVLNARKLIYLVAEPNINTYEMSIKAEPVIIDNIYTEEIKRNSVHQRAIEQRAILGNSIIEIWLAGKMKFMEAVEVGKKEYSKN